MLPVPCVARRGSGAQSTLCSTWRLGPAPGAGARVTLGARCLTSSAGMRPPASSSGACPSWSTTAGASRTSPSVPTSARCAQETSRTCPALCSIWYVIIVPQMICQFILAIWTWRQHGACPQVLLDFTLPYKRKKKKMSDMQFSYILRFLSIKE